MARTRADGDDRNRQARGSRRRQQILDAAVELFAGKGFRATGVAALAERVGLTAPGILYYFGTKERLLREVVAERDRGYPFDVPPLSLEALRAHAAEGTGDGTLTRLYLVLAAESLDPDDPLHEFFVDRYELTREFWRSLLRVEQAAGRVRSDVDADALATEILGTLLGLEAQALMDPARIDLAAAMTSYLDRLRQSLAP